MAIIGYQDVILLLFSFILFLYIWTTWGRTHTPTDWPFVGMLPGLLRNAHRIHDFATDILKESGGTLMVKGPWFAGMDIVATSDPANIHHILSKNFSNYPKGPQYRKIFDILGDGIFNSDSQLWEVHRKITMSLMNHSQFQILLERSVWQKVQTGLIPLIELVVKQRGEVDLQEIFQRFTFDSICSLVLDYDPNSLSIDLPYIACEKAFSDTEEALLYRHILPESCWKLQNWLKIGREKKLKKSWETFDEFIFKCLKEEHRDHQDDDFSLFTSYKKVYKEKGNKFLRDTFLSLMIAGRDTTSTALTWFFWLISTHPSVEKKLLEEINNKLDFQEDKKWRIFEVEDLRKLVYLHGALCEALRLFPPVSLEHKAPVEPDTLPSGLWIDRNTKVVLSLYSMGRMESIWGKDCLEFKPERWISERGGIKHEPSFKFPAFNAGPRTCIGKDMAFTQMKIVATTIIYNYQVEVVEGHPITPSDSIILQMKYGLKVRFTKRSV